MTFPLVSIITPLYNAERYIAETIQSVIDQTYQNWEMLIVDDRSTDNSTAKVLEFVKKDNRIKLFALQENKGTPSFARNLATENAKGEIIAFIDSDDLWLPQKLELQVKLMLDNNYPIVFSSYRKFTDIAKDTDSIIEAPPRVDFKTSLKSNRIGISTAIYNVNIVGKLYQITKDNHLYRGCEDYVMWLGVLKKGFVAYSLKQALMLYRVHANGMSSSKISMAKAVWNIHRKVLNNNTLYSMYFFFTYALAGIKKMIT